MQVSPLKRIFAFRAYSCLNPVGERSDSSRVKAVWLPTKIICCVELGPKTINAPGQGLSEVLVVIILKASLTHHDREDNNLWWVLEPVQKGKVDLRRCGQEPRKVKEHFHYRPRLGKENIISLLEVER